MKLPNGDRAIIEREKLESHVLSLEHPVGRFKARAFRSRGWEARDWRSLAAELRRLAVTEPAEAAGSTRWGVKYLVRGRVGAGRRSIAVVSVWIVRAGETRPRLVTVYPE